MTASTCGCAYDWRVEALDISTGGRKAILHPVSFDFEELLNEVGSGSVTLNVRDVNMSDIWPHATKIAFLRLAGPNASPSTPVCEWVGLVESVQADSGGTLKLGLKSVEEYLDHRLLPLDLSQALIDQCLLGALIVDQAATNGIGLESEWVNSTQPNRTRDWKASDYPTILSLVRGLTEIDDGPDYVLSHGSTGHPTTITFMDRAGGASSINAKRGLVSYSLDVDGSTHANRIVGTGANEGLLYIADFGEPVRWERAESYGDAEQQATVQEQAVGAVYNDHHPRATPQVTIAGVDLIAPLSLGDDVELTMGHGALQYKGSARLVGIAWSSSADSPTMASLTFVPGTSGVSAVFDAPHTDGGCC